MTFGYIPNIRPCPPIGMEDTIVIKGNKLLSVHPPVVVFTDQEIVGLHQGVKIEDFLDFPLTSNEKGQHILQQQATRGCTAAVAAMLILDYHRGIDLVRLSRCNLGTDNDIVATLHKQGLPTIQSSPPYNESSYLWLIQAIQENGSAIVTLNGNKMRGAHVVIVDEILNDGVRLREPYHGWDMTVTTEGFMRYWQPFSGIIQINSALT